MFQKSRSADQPLKIGSVKTNIGHTETASGLAAIIKVCLALENKQIPPSINFEEPNPDIKFEEWGLKVCDSPSALSLYLHHAGAYRA